MASGKNTPNMTIRHAVMKDHPLRIEYETYRRYRTGKKLCWVLPSHLTESEIETLLTNLFRGKNHLFDGLYDRQTYPDGVSMAVWSDTFLSEGKEMFFWTRVEDNFGNQYYTDQIDRVKYPKSSNHRNDNNL